MRTAWIALATLAVVALGAGCKTADELVAEARANAEARAAEEEAAAERAAAKARARPRPTPTPTPTATAARQSSSGALVIEEVSWRRTSPAYMTASGIVRNGTARTIQWIQVEARVRDAGGSLLGVETTYLRPSELRPGEDGTFQILFGTTANGTTVSTRVRTK